MCIDSRAARGLAGLELFFLGTQVDSRRCCLEILFCQVIETMKKKGLSALKSNYYASRAINI